MIGFWFGGFIFAPKIKYHEIPPFLRRGTKVKNLHALVLISFTSMVVLAGTLMPLHFIDLDESCVIGTDRAHVSA